MLTDVTCPIEAIGQMAEMLQCSPPCDGSGQCLPRPAELKRRTLAPPSAPCPQPVCARGVMHTNAGAIRVAHGDKFSLLETDDDDGAHSPCVYLATESP